jgi:glycoprotein-N-acetylgalactosamine 3-beta-galactosyltransferase
MDWYMKEVSPLLLQELPSVKSRFQTYLSSSYADKQLHSLVDQYSKTSNVPVDAAVTNKLAGYKTRFQDAAAIDRDMVEVKHAYIEDMHAAHVAHVQTSLACEDENFFGAPGCAKFKESGSCATDYGMFGCPKTCGHCDADGVKLCADYFLKKCPDMKASDPSGCDTTWMKKNCRLTCEMCSLQGKAVQPVKAIVDTAAHATHVTPVIPVLPTSDIDSTAIKSGDVSKFDPYLMHRRYLNGEIADPDDPSSCSLNNHPNGDLLSRIVVEKTSVEPKVFCGIYTMLSNHPTNVKATAETWAKRCDGFVAFSTDTDVTVSAMKIEHEGQENYNNMWQKSRSIWKYIAEHYIDDFDFFLMGGDDMFYIIENLKYYLASDEIRAEVAKGRGVYLGRKFQPPNNLVFNSGGAGYILDKAALRILKDHIDLPGCFPHQVGFWEDVNIANCLKTSNAIVPYDTRDHLKRERFHPFTPGQHLTYRTPPKPDWYAQYNPDLTFGYDCCSDRSISFHYVPHDLMRQMHAFVYSCKNKVIRNNQYP